jgi:predicted nucleotidyltransferase
VTSTSSPPIHDLREARLVPEDAVAVYISGSRVLGWGHANSDIDLFIVASELPAPDATGADEISSFHLSTDPAEILVGVAFVGGERCDLEYWRETQVEQLLQRVEESDIAGGRPPPALITRETEFLFRLGVGQALLGSEWLAERQARLEESDFRAVCAAIWLDKADAFVDDAVGLLQSGDPHSAALAAREGFGFTIDALLAYAGSLHPNVKWRARKLRTTPLTAISFDEYWAYETMADLDQEDPAPWVERVLARTQELMLGMELS